MKHFLVILSIGACVTVLSAPQAALGDVPATDDDDDGSFSLNPNITTERICETVDKREGICVEDYMCNDKHEIEVGGIIEDSDLRNGDCPDLQWCCVHPNMSLFTNTTVTKPEIRGCRSGLKDSCPWCVAVYWNSPRTNSPNLICGGAVVGSRFVLTSASCALAHRKSDLWVQLPGSTKKYPVNSTVKHKQYSSGTREHDIALLLLTEDVASPEGPKDDQGACLGLRTPLEGECVAIGFDETDQLKFTPLTVTAKNCLQQGSTYDAACGRASGTCSVVQGSPVLCPFNSAEYIVAGVARQICMKNSTTLGSLSSSAEWITEELTKLTLAADRYTING